MTNLEKYDLAFTTCLPIKREQLNDETKYLRTDGWTSLSHYEMMAELEDAFDITLSTTDVIKFNSYNRGKQILKTYGIEIE